MANKMEHQALAELRTVLASKTISTAFSVLFLSLFGVLFGFGMLPKHGLIHKALGFILQPHVINTSNLAWMRLYSNFYLVLGLVNFFNTFPVVSRNQLSLTASVNLIWMMHVLVEFISYKTIAWTFITGVGALFAAGYLMERSAARKRVFDQRDVGRDPSVMSSSKLGSDRAASSVD